jgi:nicotinate-nucleotide pyrophosphorylase
VPVPCPVPCPEPVPDQVESGTVCQEKQLILQASGTAIALHSGWRVALNLTGGRKILQPLN